MLTMEVLYLNLKKTILRIIFICGSVTLVVVGCDRNSPVSSNIAYVNPSSLGIEIFQGPRRADLVPVTSSTKDILSADLDARTFQLRVPEFSYGNAMQICIWTDDSIFQSVKIGSSTKSSRCFAPGTGMAASNKPGDMLILKKTAHNYITEERLEYLSKGLRGVTVEKLNFNRKEYSITKQKFPIYMVVFIDLNKDKIINDHEIDFFTLNF